MTAFHDVKLPLELALGARGGPERLTEIVSLASGREARNARWGGSRRRWDVGGGVISMDQAHALTAFFEARRGRLHGFRFRDHTDCNSSTPTAAVSRTDQVIGAGNGAIRSFQLKKTYASGGADHVRLIAKPVEGSVLVAVNGVAASGFTVDLSTGLVTFASAPAADAMVSAGFVFDTPVRFDTDRLLLSIESTDAVRVGPLPLIEITG